MGLHSAALGVSSKSVLQNNDHVVSTTRNSMKLPFQGATDSNCSRSIFQYETLFRSCTDLAQLLYLIDSAKAMCGCNEPVVVHLSLCSDMRSCSRWYQVTCIGSWCNTQ